MQPASLFHSEHEDCEGLILRALKSFSHSVLVMFKRDNKPNISKHLHKCTPHVLKKRYARPFEVLQKYGKLFRLKLQIDAHIHSWNSPVNCTNKNKCMHAGIIRDTLMLTAFPEYIVDSPSLKPLIARCISCHVYTSMYICCLYACMFHLYVCIHVDLSGS